MATRHDATPGTGHPTGLSGARWRRDIEWFLGIVGALALFLGFFILFAGDNQSVGLFGEWSWKVGDIAPAWGYALLAGGGVLLATLIGLLVRGRR